MLVQDGTPRILNISSVDGKGVVLEYKGSRTIAVIDVDGMIGVGVARCNPADRYNKEIGTNIAIARAAKMIISGVERTWVERAKTEVEVLEARDRKRNRRDKST